MNLDLLFEKFPNIYIENDKIIVNNALIVEVLHCLKHNSQYLFNILLTFSAIDLQDNIELRYELYSIDLKEKLIVSSIVNGIAKSVTSVYKSAGFDEREIFDLFGIIFDGNSNLKRLFMPESWIGHPLLKNYKMEDARLSWNE